MSSFTIRVFQSGGGKFYWCSCIRLKQSIWCKSSYYGVLILGFNTTFDNISAIPWRSA